MFYKNGGGLTSEICLAEKGEGYSSYYDKLKFLEVHVYMYVCKFYITLMNQKNLSSNVMYVSTQKNSLSPENILKLYF